ncbi:ABC transporter permease [Methylobacterium haplocladii]|uniref:Transport permease protein n=1 Tax=Methylobacterium haplocladii TaxID=1176176 RepID=A0A512ITN1_9HYPH|nr:ABC transporter permease [Methylobacterium haplocladii]GEP01051.1 transport permease protein [Methylobacterium haplocladii]GJD85644.1 Polysialic acid transport protein KpsM [Methylobacterium haplocladii]GLS60511.1 transport permease protein [Methylobacterium haplocladii]
MQLEIPSLGPRSIFSKAERIDSYLRVLNALMLRDMRTRFAGSYWGYLVQVLWPVAHMFIIATAMAFRHVPPPFGDSTMVFAATGAIPALAFQYISREIMKGIMQNKPLTYYPQVRTLDVMFSRVLVEIVSSFLGVMLILTILFALGLNPIPKDITTAICGYLSAIALGIGVGTVNVAIIQVFPGWLLGYIGIGILLYIASGVMFLASDFPEQIYYYLKWNPILQLVEWVRLGYDPTLPITIDYIYLFLWIFGSLSLGLALERTIGRRGSA